MLAFSDKWERHRLSDRYWRNTAGLFTSTVFRRILRPVLVFCAWAALLCVHNLYLCPLGPTLPFGFTPFPLTLNPLPLTLLSPMVGLLLVFRTNHSYARFLEGRLLWGSAVRHCRDLARLACTRLPPTPARQHFLALLVAYTWLLKAHLRAGRTRTDPADVTAYRDDPTANVLATGLPPPLAQRLLASTNRPYACLLAISALIAELDEGPVPANAASSPRLGRLGDALERIVTELGAVTGGCERILSTPLPLSYTRFTARALVCWLLALPFALIPQLGWATIPVQWMSVYLVLGIDEVGIEIEEPFSILPLQALCEAVRRDVGLAQAESEI